MTWGQFFIIIGVVAIVFAITVAVFKLINRCRCDRRENDHDPR